MKHLGLASVNGASVNGHYDEGLGHLAEVNAWTPEGAEGYARAAFTQWEKRSLHEWTIDVGVLAMWAYWNRRPTVDGSHRGGRAATPAPELQNAEEEARRFEGTEYGVECSTSKDPPPTRNLVERINVARDIQPLSAFRKQASALIDRLQKSRRPLVLTRNGRSAVVVLDVGEFERMVERIELLEDVQTAREQARRSETVPHGEALAYLSDRLGATGDDVNEIDGNAENA